MKNAGVFCENNCIYSEKHPFLRTNEESVSLLRGQQLSIFAFQNGKIVVDKDSLIRYAALLPECMFCCDARNAYSGKASSELFFSKQRQIQRISFCRVYFGGSY